MVHLKNYYPQKVLVWQNEPDRALLQKSLDENKASITNTDTVFGFLTNLSKESFGTLNTLKGGRQEKPYLILISPPHINHFVDPSNLTPQLKNFLAQCWPGPVTIIFKALNTLPSHLVSTTGTVALRCPDHDGLQKILPFYQGLFSTSANRSGAPTPSRQEDIDTTLFEEVSYLVIDGEEKASLASPPSSIIDLSDVYCPKLIRAGAYTIEKLEHMYGIPFQR